MKTLKVKAGSDRVHERIQAKWKARLPKSAEGGTFRYARSTEGSPTEIKHVVTTGIKAFDDRVGGMPFGKATELVGLPQSGKTSMAVRTAVRAQLGFIFERKQTPDGRITLSKLKPGSFAVTVAYYDQEGSLSDYDKRIVDGIMLDAEVNQCDTVELMWATMDDVMMVLEEEQEASGILQFLIVIIDTVGSLSTKSEYLAAWGKQDFPRVPAELKTGMKVMIGRMQRENVMLMGLNHVSRRMDIRGKVAYKGWEYNAPGGKAFSYYAFHRVFFEMLQNRYCLAGKGGQDGFIIYFCTLKNRLKQPLREGRLALLFTVKDEKTGELVREGGFYDGYSLLESLIYGKAVKISKETGALVFGFSRFGIETATFNPQDAMPSLEEQEETEAPPPRRKGRRLEPAPDTELEPAPDAPPKKPKRDPKIPNRASWGAFYEQHKDDLDRLYAEVTRRAMAASDLVGACVDDDDIEPTEAEGS